MAKKENISQLEENLKITVRENGGDTKYDYSFFKEEFGEWTKKLDVFSPDINDLRQYLTECGYDVIKIG